MEFLIALAVGIGIIALFSLILGFPIMWLWNWLVPPIFSLPEIGFWQAVGLYFLFGLLFKNSGTGKSE